MQQPHGQAAATATAHEHHKGKGDCTTCSAHKLNTCVCGHLVYVYGKDGCMFSIPQPSGVQRYPWPSMYPTQQSLKDREQDMGEIPWEREMLLKIVADEDQIIKPEDIHYYDEKPTGQLVAMKGTASTLPFAEREREVYGDCERGVLRGRFAEDLYQLELVQRTRYVPQLLEEGPRHTVTLHSIPGITLVCFQSFSGI